MKNIVQEAREKQRAYVATALKAGYSVKAIAAHLELTTQRVYQIKASADKDAKAAKRKLARERRAS